MNFGTQQCWPDGTNIGGQAGNNDRNFIRDLTAGSSNNFLIGVVISKLSVHSFPDKKNPGTERYSLGFTLRDSPTDFINVTCWGGEHYITDIANSFKLNDIVEIRNPLVSPKQGNDFELQWKPWTSRYISPYLHKLNVSEAHSTVALHTSWDNTEFNLILHTPIKESGDYCSLADIMSSGQNIHGDHMNVLVIVKNVGVPKDVQTKKGKQIKKCDVQILDDTCQSFQLTLWDEERIEFAMSWTAGETVLFIADLKIIHNEYRKTMASVCDNKTIITVNPDIRQAHQLYSYAQSPEVLNGIGVDNNGGDRRQFTLEGIDEIYTLEEIKQIIAKGNIQPEGVTGIVYACLTSFNIDGNMDNVLSLRWDRAHKQAGKLEEHDSELELVEAKAERNDGTTCRRRMNTETKLCENPSCMAQHNGDGQLNYDLAVDVSDCSGTLNSCRLLSTAMETMLGYSPEQFKRLPQSAVSEFKMKYLLERCKLYFKISSWSNSILVLSCANADTEEALESIKI